MSEEDQIPAHIQYFRSVRGDQRKFLDRYEKFSPESLRKILIRYFHEPPESVARKWAKTLSRRLYDLIALSGDGDIPEEEGTNKGDEPAMVDENITLDSSIWEYRFDTRIGYQTGKNEIKKNYKAPELKWILENEFGDTGLEKMSDTALITKLADNIKDFHKILYHEEEEGEEDDEKKDSKIYSHVVDEETVPDDHVHEVEEKLRKEFGKQFELIAAVPRVFRESFTEGWDQMRISSTANSLSEKPRPNLTVLWGNTFYSIEDWNAQVDKWLRIFPRIPSHEREKFNDDFIKFCWDTTTSAIWEMGSRYNTRSSVNPFIPVDIKKKFRTDMWGNVVSENARKYSLCKAVVDHIFPHARGGRTIKYNAASILHSANSYVKKDLILQTINPQHMLVGISAPQLISLFSYIEQGNPKKGNNFQCDLHKIMFILEATPRCVEGNAKKGTHRFFNFQKRTKGTLDGEELFHILLDYEATHLTTPRAARFRPGTEAGGGPAPTNDDESTDTKEGEDNVTPSKTRKAGDDGHAPSTTKKTPSNRRKST